MEDMAYLRSPDSRIGYFHHRPLYTEELTNGSASRATTGFERFDYPAIKAFKWHSGTN